MKRYEVEVIVTVVLDDNSDEETAYDTVAAFMSDAYRAVPDKTAHAMTWAMLDDCVTEAGGGSNDLLG